MIKQVAQWAVVAHICLVVTASGDETPEQMSDRWWTDSWYNETSPTEDWKVHVELSIGGESVSGNESGEELSGTWLTVVRKKTLSLYSDGQVDLTDKNFGVLGDVDQLYLLSKTVLRYDLGGQYYVSGGFSYEQDDASFLDQRLGLFVGVGTRVELAPTVSLSLYGAVGEDTSHFNGDVISSAGLSLDGVMLDADAFGSLLSQAVRWEVKPDLALSEQTLFFFYEGNELEDRWQGDVSLDYSLTPYLALVLKYSIRIEDNPVLQALGGETENKGTTVSLKLQI